MLFCHNKGNACKSVKHVEHVPVLHHGNQLTSFVCGTAVNGMLFCHNACMSAKHVEHVPVLHHGNCSMEVQILYS